MERGISKRRHGNRIRGIKNENRANKGLRYMEKGLIMKRGEVYYADLGEGIGCEQIGKRPVVIIQNDTGNKHSTTVIVACITSKTYKRKLPTHVLIGKEQMPKKSIIMLEQIRTIDVSRICEWITTLSSKQMEEIDKALIISLGIINDNKVRK